MFSALGYQRYDRSLITWSVPAQWSILTAIFKPHFILPVVRAQTCRALNWDSTLGTDWGRFFVSDWKVLLAFSEWDQGCKHPTVHRTVPYIKESSFPQMPVVPSTHREQHWLKGFWKEWEVNAESY